MAHEKLNPEQLAAVRVRNSISLAAINPEYTAETIVLQFLYRRYGLAPEIASAIADLAGLGPRGVRS
jgi:hypothetical protein